MPTAQIYIKRTQEETWKTFKKYCDNNGFSISGKIMEFVQKMADIHGDGGSQTYLENAGKPKTVPFYKTCHFSNKEKSKGEIYCGKINDWRLVKACEVCGDYDE